MTKKPKPIWRAAHYVSKVVMFGLLVYVQAYVQALPLIVWVMFGVVIGSPPIETIKALILWKNQK